MGAVQLVVGAVLEIQKPERAAPIGVALGGALIVAMGALAAWGGRRLRQSGADARGWAR
jgi:hypothetical protein